MNEDIIPGVKILGKKIKKIIFDKTIQKIDFKTLIII